MANTLKIRAKEFTALTKALKDKAKQELMISMADPLPHPSKDTRKKPNPNSKPSSPYEDWRDYKGKGPAKASLENPKMDILLPYKNVPKDDRDYGEGNVPGHPDWKLAGLMDDLKIDPAGHKGAQKKTKIYNKATQGSGSEKEWLKKTGPQLPLASVPSSRTIRDHLKKGTKGLRDYDDAGGGRAIPKKEWLELIRSVPKA